MASLLRSQSVPELLVPILISTGFAGTMLVYRTLYPDNFDFLTTDEVAIGFLTSVCTFWFAVKLSTSTDADGPWLRFFDEFRIGTGMNLIVQALLNYFDILTRSMFLIVVGGVFAALLLAIARSFLSPKGQNVYTGTLVVGGDGVSPELAPLLTNQVVGVIGAAPGTTSRDALEEALARKRPRQILVTAEGAALVAPSVLLAQRLKGFAVSSTPELYERLLERVYCQGRNPVDLVLSPPLSGKAQAMAIQAIYTNVIGLVLLVAASPVILAVTIAILFTARGPILETVECAGFQNIPFRRMRFRTRLPEGTRTAKRLAELVARLQLADLPLLFNVVRGEMALFGPRPVRCEYARRIAEIVPFYGLRFGVKPGMITWGSVARNRPPHSCALVELEYDLYYIKHGSPMLDFGILMRRIFGGKRGGNSSVEFSPAS